MPKTLPPVAFDEPIEVRTMPGTWIVRDGTGSENYMDNARHYFPSVIDAPLRQGRYFVVYDNEQWTIGPLIAPPVMDDEERYVWIGSRQHQVFMDVTEADGWNPADHIAEHGWMKVEFIRIGDIPGVN